MTEEELRILSGFNKTGFERVVNERRQYCLNSCLSAESQVLMLLIRLRTGRSYYQLKVDFAVCYSTVQNICDNLVDTESSFLSGVGVEEY